MNKKLALSSVFALVLAGCATVPDSNSTMLDLNSRVGTLEAQNKALKEQLTAAQAEVNGARAQLNQIPVRMPNAVEIQTALKSAGYYDGVVDGKIALKTKEAIAKFQKNNGLTSDGVMGSRTWEKLAKYLK